MKFLLILLSLVVINLAQRRGQMNLISILLGLGPNGLSARCITESGATQADIKEIRSNQFPSQRAGRCLLSCIEQAVGIQGADGKPTLTGIAEIVLNQLREVNRPLYDEVLKVSLKCGPKILLSKLKDPCDLAFEMASCSISEAAADFSKQGFGAFVLNAGI